MPDSAAELGAFGERVLAATESERVDLVGFAQGGGLLPRWYLKHGADKHRVAHLAGIAPSNHGTSMSGLARLAGVLGAMGMVERKAVCAAVEQATGSWPVPTLDGSGDIVEGVDYTTIVTRTDLVLIPYRSQFLNGPRVVNHILQDHCPHAFTGDLGMAFSPVVGRLALAALGSGNTVHSGWSGCEGS
ncbi:esterase/lipase family protein [Streptomyces lavendulae]|uniref:esterase/lipase family protein n=1 Tax=Streptomyces lavendulae TaxID=1914 RepID=UPI00371C9FB2